MRVESAKMFLDVIRECEYLVPQFTPPEYTNSYYSLAVMYNGEEEIGVSWQDFRKKYIEMGGDGYYGAWSVPYLEPVIVDRKFVNRCPELYEDIYYKKGICPVAERVQKKIMQFKTNYRDLNLAKIKSCSLKQTINYYKGV